MLGRMHGSLDAMQPEEQDGFRQGGRIEEHLFPAKIWLQNTLAAGAPFWVLSLDLSKHMTKLIGMHYVLR